MNPRLTIEVATVAALNIVLGTLWASTAVAKIFEFLDLAKSGDGNGLLGFIDAFEGVLGTVVSGFALVNAGILIVAGVGLLGVRPWARVLVTVGGGMVVFLIGIQLAFVGLSVPSAGILAYGLFLICLHGMSEWRAAFTNAATPQNAS